MLIDILKLRCIIGSMNKVLVIIIICLLLIIGYLLNTRDITVEENEIEVPIPVTSVFV